MESKGKAAEVEEMRKRTKEEETTSGQRENEGGREGSYTRASEFRFQSLWTSLRGKVVPQMFFGVRGDVVVTEVTKCVPDRVFDLTASPQFLFPFRLLSLSICASHNLSFSEKRSPSGTLVCGQ